MSAAMKAAMAGRHGPNLAANLVANPAVPTRNERAATMTINSLASGSSTAVTYASRVAGTSAASSASAAQQAGRMPPPPDDGGGLLGAIADALKSIGVDEGATEGADVETTSAATQGDSADTAQALGSFLESLMEALHAQGSDAGAAPAYGEPPQGGPGQLSADLQSLVAALGADADGTAVATSADSGLGALQGAFANLLTSLGGDAGDADAKLSSFLQTLSSRLPTAGSAGNLVDTTA
jgi:hypothetical protein